MTLDRHKSKVLLGVGMTKDGRLLVSDEDGALNVEGGTLGRSGGSKSKMMLSDEDIKSHLSIDSKKKGRRSSNYLHDLNKLKISGPGSVRSSVSNTSIQRKISTMKNEKSMNGGLPDVIQGDGALGLWDDYKQPNKFDTLKTWSSLGKYKKKEESLQIHGYASSYAGSMDRCGKKGKELDMESIKRYKQQMNSMRKGSKGSDKDLNKIHSSHKRLSKNAVKYKSKELKLSGEKLPGVTFIIISMILLSLGTVKVVVSWWHSYFCALWTGFIILLLGFLGVVHKGNYFSKPKSIIYTVFGILSAICALITIALTMPVFYPTVVQLALKTPLTDIISSKSLNFTNMGKSLAIQIGLQQMVWMTVVIDGIIIIFSSLSLFSMTAAIVALNNHWEAVYKYTGECDHRGSPSTFNPVSQILLGLTTLYLAVMSNALWASNAKHYFSILVAPVIVIILGFVNFCHGKRPDVRKLGRAAMVIDAFTILCVAITIILTVFGIVSDITIIDEYINGSRPGMPPITMEKYIFTLASIVAESVYIIFSLINLIFTVSVLFRTGKLLLAPTINNSKRTKK